jgi:tetratricopeptide (TPR) repeat protein
MPVRQSLLRLPGTHCHSEYLHEVRQAEMVQPAFHRAILIVDVEKFGDPARTNAHQLAVRDGMYKALQEAFARTGIGWADCEVEDRGDGILVLVPPAVPKSWLVVSVPARLTELLARHNDACPAQAQIRLRMALHAGEVHRDEHGFVGSSINRAFRLIESPASRTALRQSSGVVALIVSDWFYEEVVRHHPGAAPSRFEGVRVVMKETEMAAWVRVLGTGDALGPRDTRQVTSAPLYQLAHVGQSLAASSSGVRYSLPPDTAAFTGRDEDLERITAAVTQTAGAGGVVAIHAIDGMPGVGKTTLAVHAAHLLRHRFPDRQLFINLHAHTPGQDPLTPEEALAGLLAATGVDARHLPDDLQSRISLWRDRMAGQRAVLVLDNAADSGQVAPLLPGGGSCLVLVTSRRHLGDLPGVTIPVLLKVLSPEDAWKMFVRLAPRAAEGPDAAVQLVRLAGSLPLAISLLARVYNRHESWTLADLIAETKASMLTLAAEKDSVAAAFDVSYRYLDPGQQRFFRCLGLHPGTTIDGYAAAALAGSCPEDAAGQLDALHGEGLLTEVSHHRYGMHDLIRRYARDRAAADPASNREQALQRLLDYYTRTAARAEARLARRTRTSAAPALHWPPEAVPDLGGTAQAMRWARAERPNLIACLDHATQTGQNARIVALTAVMATLLRQDGPWTDAHARHTASAQAARDLGDRLGQANALLEAGVIMWLTGDYPGAASALEEALGIFRDLGDQLGQANALAYLGTVRWLTADFRSAASALEEALGISRRLGDQLGQANTLNDLGTVRWLTGDYPGAASALEEALGISRRLGDELGQANALTRLGVVHWLTGNHPVAAGVLEEALGIYRQLGDQRGEADALNVLGVVHWLTRDYPAAASAQQESLRISRDLGDRRGEADALNRLGGVRRLTGDHTGAASALEEALSIYRNIGDRGGEAETLNEIGMLYRICDDIHRAEVCHRQALHLAREIASPWDEAQALAGLGRCAVTAGHIADAVAALRQGREIFERIGAAEAITVASELNDLTGTGPTT